MPSASNAERFSCQPDDVFQAVRLERADQAGGFGEGLERGFAAALADYTAALQNRRVAELELRQYAAALADFDRLVELGQPGPALDGLRGAVIVTLHETRATCRH